MNIGVYAGSLRPGGGLTALKQVLGGLLEIPQAQVVVFTGAEDVSASLESWFASEPRLTEQRFLPQAGAFRRYLASKRAFRSCDFDWLISVNYHIPTNAKLLVYHLNLLSFVVGARDSIGARIKRWDARRACRRAQCNLFESQYLLERAREATKGSVAHAGLLYLGVHEDFYRAAAEPIVEPGSLLMVSSMQEHKDNATILRMLAILRSERPEVPWRLSIAGGQSVNQWAPLVAQAQQLGVDDALALLGPLAKPDLSDRMARSTCLVTASRIESFCMVALEAMASFCPAVVTDASSMPESVGDAAAVVPAGDEAAFAAEVLSLHDQQNYRAERVLAGRNRADDFRPEAFRAQLRGFLGQ